MGCMTPWKMHGKSGGHHATLCNQIAKCNPQIIFFFQVQLLEVLDLQLFLPARTVATPGEVPRERLRMSEGYGPPWVRSRGPAEGPRGYGLGLAGPRGPAEPAEPVGPRSPQSPQRARGEPV